MACAPYFITNPAMPRKDAADRYSPEIADAFQIEPTARVATKKSEVVRAMRIPINPIVKVATTTTPTKTIVQVTASPLDRRNRLHLLRHRVDIARQ